jgi:hypothetical protein
MESASSSRRECSLSQLPAAPLSTTCTRSRHSAAGPPPPPPAIDPAEVALGSLNLRRRYRSAAQRTFQESKSPLDLFDWKFEKYLTPWIVRFTWLAVLVIAGLWLTFVTISLLLSFLPDVSTPTSDFDPSSPFSVSPRSPRFETSLSDSPWLWNLVFRIVGGLTILFATLIWLLWIRVLLESAIVIFNIAKSLASIDEKTPGATS